MFECSKEGKKQPQEMHAGISEYTPLLALAHTSHNYASMTSQVGVKMCDVRCNVRHLLFMSIDSTSSCFQGKWICLNIQLL